MVQIYGYCVLPGMRKFPVCVYEEGCLPWWCLVKFYWINKMNKSQCPESLNTQIPCTVLHKVRTRTDAVIHYACQLDLYSALTFRLYYHPKLQTRAPNLFPELEVTSKDLVQLFIILKIQVLSLSCLLQTTIMCPTLNSLLQICPVDQLHQAP